MIRALFAAFLVLHGLIHLIGFSKAFGFAAVSQLSQPISRAGGLAWLVAAILLFASAAALYAWPRGFWMVGAVALVLSQALICGAWRDAKFGTVASLVVLAGVSYGFLSRGPWSFRASFEKDAAAALARRSPQPLVTEADLAPLPEPVRRYLRAAGVVGQERVQGMKVRFTGLLRGGPAEPWMPITAEQYSFFDEPARLFLVEAKRSGIPFEAFHRFVGPSATFAVKVASLVPVTDARGPVMNRSETVTHFNDMAVLAPATLLSPSIRWEPVDDRTVRAAFTRGAETVRAELRFDPEGWLVDFLSDDRSMASKDGKSFTAARWSTPLHDVRSFGAFRLASRGEAIWHVPEGAYEYGRFDFVEIEYNPSGPP